jgi:F-type H+-transporting ATPase subunit b
MVFTSTGVTLPTSQDFISKLIPNWISFVVQLLALIVLILAVIFFAYKPVKKIIKTRQDYIENNIKEAEENNAKAKSNFTASEEALIAKAKEANLIVENAKSAALSEQEKIKTDTEIMISKMKLQAEQDITKAKEDAKEDIRREMVDIALTASKEVLKREINSNDNEKIVDDFIRSLEK